MMSLNVSSYQSISCLRSRRPGWLISASGALVQRREIEKSAGMTRRSVGGALAPAASWTRIDTARGFSSGIDAGSRRGVGGVLLGSVSAPLPFGAGIASRPFDCGDLCGR